MTIAQLVEAQISSFVEVFSDTTPFTVQFIGDVIASLKTQQFDKQVVSFWTSDSSGCISGAVRVITIATFPAVLIHRNGMVTRDYG